MPFVIALRLGGGEADALLLCISIVVVLASVVGGGYETASVAAFASDVAEGRAVSNATLRSFVAHAGTVSLVVGLVGYPTIAAVYVVSASASARGPLVEGFVVAAVPAIAQIAVWAASSPLGALVILSKSLPLYYVSVGIRSLPGLIAVFMQLPIGLVVTSMLFGEVLRLLMLRVVVAACKTAPLKSYDGTVYASPTRPKLVALANQMSSMSISQLAPIVARTVFVTAGAGFVTAAEIANRLYTVGTQIAMSIVVMPQVAEIGNTLSGRSERRSPRRENRRVTRLVALQSLLLGGVGVAGSPAVALYAGAIGQDTIALGGWWAIVLYLGLPFFALNAWATRVLVVAERTRWLPLIGLSYLVATAGMTAASWVALGPIAGIMGLTAGTIVSAVFAVVMSFRSLRA